MSLLPLPPDWPGERATVQRIATHALAQARKRQDNIFDLVPSIGGFATAAVGDERERVRVSGRLLIVERAIGPTLSDLTASTTTTCISGSSIEQLCRMVGFEPSADFSAGPETPPLGDVTAPLELDPASGDVLGEWYLLGQRAIDEAVASVDEPLASLGRLWPEHFDYGTDIDARPGVRTNLGAAGDGSHQEPYLYVGPWSAQRPGPSDFWNATFGAMRPWRDRLERRSARPCHNVPGRGLGHLSGK